jgi:hypothetical protein
MTSCCSFASFILTKALLLYFAEVQLANAYDRPVLQMHGSGPSPARARSKHSYPGIRYLVEARPVNAPWEPFLTHVARIKLT